MSRRLTLPVEALSKDTQKFYDVLNDQPDVVVIVVAASYLDSCLAAILERLLIKSRVSDCMLDVQGGVLGSFLSLIHISEPTRPY